ncbi:MAG: metallophosphatase family protein [Candidatus Omnitrophica bacterium]|nr:metallophosphatase family protein [Candidatus Omnitrophota bacterium]
MKIGVISDTHIPVYCDCLPDAIVEHFRDVDMIIHAGDIVEPDVLRALQKTGIPVEAVCGNMDCADIQSKLPVKKTIKAGKYTIGLIHGWGSPQSLTPEVLRKEFKHVDVIVFGHTHQPMNQEIDGVLYFNPGSATDAIFAERRTIGILDLDGGKTGTIITL